VQQTQILIGLIEAPSMLDEVPSPSPQPCVKVPNFPGLYRHSGTGNYYGVKKLHGRRKERSLGTADRKIAERRFREWVENLGKVDSEVEKTTLGQLAARLHAVNGGGSDGTQAATRAIVDQFIRWLPFGATVQVREIRPSQLDEWLALHERRLKNTSYNRYAGCLKQLFDVAVKDRIISESPCKNLKTPWKRPQKPVRRIPTIEQFHEIVDSIRGQRFTDHAQDTGDFVEFLGLAGLGQAEASSLTWGDVDWASNRLSIRRHKTDTRFHVPIYDHLRPLLERLHREWRNQAASTLVFKIKDAKKALKSACARLGLPNYSQRNLRQCLIMRLWKSGVDKKLIAKWQGHRDGGQLIMDTYTEVFGADDDEYEKQQLGKIMLSRRSQR
jgi:integrase